MTRLVIVESPAKAKKIGQYLGSGYVVEASVGHIRDLPQRAADIPATHKGLAWAKEGVNVDNGFEPLYVVDTDKKKKVSELKALLKDSTELLLATDEDREGEAIAWHLLEVLKPKVPVRRMVFHEITPEAIRSAAENTRELDQRLVDAQETASAFTRSHCVSSEAQSRPSHPPQLDHHWEERATLLRCHTHLGSHPKSVPLNLQA